VGDEDGLPVVLDVKVAELDCVPVAVRAWLDVPVAVNEGVTLGVAPWLGDCVVVGVDDSVPMVPVRVGVRVFEGVWVALDESDWLCDDN
jgi:hypothetical protein